DDLLNMLEQALAQQPNDAFALEVKGDVLRRLGRYDAAVEAFDRLLSVAPDNAAVLRMKGEVLQKLGRYEEALQVLDRSLVIEPGAVSGLQVRGETLRRCERYGEALQALDAALAQQHPLRHRRVPSGHHGARRGHQARFFSGLVFRSQRFRVGERRRRRSRTRRLR